MARLNANSLVKSTYKTNNKLCRKKQNLGVWSWREEAGGAHSEDEYWDPGVHQRKDGYMLLTVSFVKYTSGADNNIHWH